MNRGHQVSQSRRAGDGRQSFYGVHAASFLIVIVLQDVLVRGKLSSDIQPCT